MTELENKIYLVIANATALKVLVLQHNLVLRKNSKFHTGEQLGIEGCRQTRIGF